MPLLFRFAEVLLDFGRGIGGSGLVVSHRGQGRTRTKTGRRGAAKERPFLCLFILLNRFTMLFRRRRACLFTVGLVSGLL